MRADHHSNGCISHTETPSFSVMDASRAPGHVPGLASNFRAAGWAVPKRTGSVSSPKLPVSPSLFCPRTLSDLLGRLKGWEGTPPVDKREALGRGNRPLGGGSLWVLRESLGGADHTAVRPPCT